MLTRIACVLLLSLSASSAFAACAYNDTVCQNMENAKEVTKRQQEQQQKEQQQRYNQQNGTSQYSGPTVGYDKNKNTPTIGYQKSVK
jgi:opacity protein-like surface antigen